MKAVETTGPFATRVVELEMPVPGDGQVLVKMLAVGICASDMQVWHGKHKYVKFPFIQGHEGIGKVMETGAGVELNKGDLVNIQQQFACGECYACKKGRHNVCVNLKGVGILADGLFCEYFLSPAWNAIRLPDGFSLEKGMLVEPVSVGVNSVRVAQVRPGERVVVIGAGTIGNFTAQAARAVGAADVLITDIADAKLDVARKNGIRHCVNTRNTPLGPEILKAFDGNHADLIFDCAGVEASIKQALAEAANSSRVVLVASFKEPITLDIASFQRREVHIVSIMGTTKESTAEAIDFLHRGLITTNGVISKRFPLERMQEAYQYIDDNPTTVMKVGIDIAAE